MSPDFSPAVLDYLGALKASLDRLPVAEIDAVLNVLREAYEQDRAIYVMGNGGSAATASHLVVDLNKGACLMADKKFRVMCLNDSVPTLTALGNDLGYDYVFVEPLKNFARPGDVVIAISGSGNSPNVLKAIEYANAAGCQTVGLSGYDGGRLKQIARYNIHAAVEDMQLVEDIHMVMVHVMLRMLDANGGGACCPGAPGQGVED